MATDASELSDLRGGGGGGGRKDVGSKEDEEELQPGDEFSRFIFQASFHFPSADVKKALRWLMTW